MEQEPICEKDLSIIKDKAELLKAKRDLKLNNIITQTIHQDTLINRATKYKYRKLNELLKPDSLYQNLVNDSNRNLLNKMPYLIFGLVESVFVDEEKSEKTKEYGCGILIDSSVILLPAKNLIFDNESFNEQQNNNINNQGNNENKEANKTDYNFKLFEIDFKPLNISPEYRSYLPKAIKVIDHYTPLNNYNNEMNSNENSKGAISKDDLVNKNKKEEEKKQNNSSEEETIDKEKLINSWGLALLEYPIGDIINYIYYDSQNNNYDNRYNNKSKMRRKGSYANIYGINENNKSIMNDLKIKNLSNQELEQCNIHFLECFPKKIDPDYLNNMNNTKMDNINNINNINNIDNVNNEQQVKEQDDGLNPPPQDNNQNNNNIENQNNQSNKLVDSNAVDKPTPDPNQIQNENNVDNLNNMNNINNQQQSNYQMTSSPSLIEEENDDYILYNFNETYYDMEFDTQLIYLNSPNQDQIIDENIIPGFIVGYYMKKYYILGMNTNTMIKYSINDNELDQNMIDSSNKDCEETQEGDKKEETQEGDKKEANESATNKNNQENNELNNNNNQIQENTENLSTYIYHIAIRFTEQVADKINQKVIEYNEQYPNEMNFNKTIFTILCKKITTKNYLLSLLKNNCEGLYKLILSLKNDKSITDYDKSCLDLEIDQNLKFIQFSLMLIWNKYTSSLIESKIIDVENLKIGYFPGSSILSSIIQSKESLTTLNLKNNEMFSEGIKEIMLPIFNKKKILDIGKELKCLCLDSNKLNGKSLKYIRYLIKVSPQLTLISLSNNYITGSSLRHLLNASKSKESMLILYLNSNMLGSNCGENLNKILLNFNNLKELNLSCNSLGDAPIPFILNALKQNNKIEILLLSNNEITKKSANSIANFLSNNRVLRILWLNNNPLEYEGIKMISQVLSTKLVLEEINLNSVRATDEGGKEIFENLKMNKSIKNLLLNSNELGSSSMEKFGEFMRKDNENQNSEGGLEIVSLSLNAIDDECVKLFVEELTGYRWIREIKLNSNFISDDGGKLILCASLQNNSINKVNLENNRTTWVINNEIFKSIRGDIQIFF